jgi:YfiH family protein
MTEAVLEEQAVPGPVPLFEVPGWRQRFGVVAGITGRGAGDPFDLGMASARPAGGVFGDWTRFREAHPAFPAVIVSRQVHGSEVAWHASGAGWQIHDGWDGHATRAAGVLLTVTVADCIPVYLADPAGKAISLLHCGWRGVSSGILARGIGRLARHGTVVSDLVMHCGVGICGPCYEVGSEVLEACGQRATGAGPWHIDLREVLASQARAEGVRAISTSQFCSCHHRDRFFSHRGSGGRDGRMVAYLGLLP